jgi:hypothetical protein
VYGQEASTSAPTINKSILTLPRNKVGAGLRRLSVIAHAFLHLLRERIQELGVKPGAAECEMEPIDVLRRVPRPIALESTFSQLRS